MHHDHLFQRQIELEIEMAGIGRSRYFSRIRKDIDAERGYETKTGRCILEASIEPVAEGIRLFVEEVYSGRPGPRAVAAKLIKDMDYKVIAYLASRAILGRMMKPKSAVLMTLANTVARAVEHEARFTAFMKADPDRFAWLTKKLSDDGATEQHKATVLTYAMGKHGIAWDRWSRTDMIHLGIKMVELFAAHTGLVRIEQAHTGGDKEAPRDQYLVTLTDRARAWIDQSVTGGSVLSIAYLPTLIPPKDWTGLEGGGYHTELDRPLPLVRRGRANHMALLKGADLSVVLRAVNALQRTPWRINTAILDVMKQLAKFSDGVAGLVPSRDLDMPERPHDIDTNAEALREWKWLARDTYVANLQLRQDRLKQAQLFELAERFREEQAIYFPHNLDFRGRAYPVPDVLHPQGSDPVKALLYFAEGKPLGEDGARWLAIHGANTFGIDKVSFDERVAWVEENQERIHRCALDPVADQWWTEADKPWCFLAFCFEWLSFHVMGHDMVSRLPIALDGSCNGLQHFSAMLRDSVGGRAVNLIPAEKPQDIYQVVADRVMAKLRLDLSTRGADTQEGRWTYEWLTMGVDRKVTKRPVMVLPYGGTPRSCLRYVEEAVKAKIAAGYKPSVGDELKKAIGLLSSTVWDSIGDVVVSAREAMGWLQKTARVVAKGNHTLHWTTPSGFIAFQGYVDMRERRIKTRIAGEIVKLRLYDETDKIDVSKQATSISPNFVHSMDASAMILTVDALSASGLSSFAMIHDSYGTHACDTTKLASTLRRVFVSMYEQNPLERFRNEVIAASPNCEVDKIDELPNQGDLDLSAILHSDFFFA